MINKKISKVINIGSGKQLNLINLVKQIKEKYKFKTKLELENKKYPGLFANINLLRKTGYKKKMKKFFLN